MIKPLRRLISSAAFLVLTGLMIFAAKKWSALVFAFYPKLSRKILAFLADLTAPIPVPVWELAVCALAVWLVVSLILSLRKSHFLRWLTGVLEIVCAGVFLFVAYMDSVPRELEESAFIDGAGVVQTYIQIVFPLVKPMTATIMILNGLSVWNDFMLPLLLLNKSKDSWTLQLFQYNFKTTYSFDYNLAFASFLLSMLPVMVVYVFAQKYIIQGLTTGAVKG